MFAVSVPDWRALVETGLGWAVNARGLVTMATVWSLASASSGLGRVSRLSKLYRMLPGPPGTRQMDGMMEVSWGRRSRHRALSNRGHLVLVHVSSDKKSRVSEVEPALDLEPNREGLNISIFSFSISCLKAFAYVFGIANPALMLSICSDYEHV